MDRLSKSALASLTDQYTDSENEEDRLEVGSSDSQISHKSEVLLPQNSIASTNEVQPATKTKAKKRKAVRRLVSYQDDTVVSASSDSSYSEEEDVDMTSKQSLPSPSNGGSFLKEIGGSPGLGSLDFLTSGDFTGKAEVAKEAKSIKYANYSFTLPPSPSKAVASDLSEKVRNLYEKMETNNMDMNRIIQGRKEFRNPSIYEKLIHFCGINEFGTNYPPEIYDPLKWGVESYYEELARVQKNDMQKRQKERKEMDKIEQAIAVARKVEEDAKKRKSKWDQPATKVVVPPTLTTTVTGTKGTVISAFGSLPNKKPAN